MQRFIRYLTGNSDQPRGDIESVQHPVVETPAYSNTELLANMEPIAANENATSDSILLLPVQDESTTAVEQAPAAETFTHRQIIASYSAFIFTRDNYPQLIFASLLTVLGTGLNFLAPYLLGVLVESLNNKDESEADSYSTQMSLISFLVLIYTLAQIVPVLRERTLVPVAANNTKQILTQITEHQLNKSLNYHIVTPPGDQIYLLQKSFAVAGMGTPLLTKVAPALVEVIIAVCALSKEYGAPMGMGLSTLFALYTTYCALTTKPIIRARENMLNTGREAWTSIVNTINRYKTIHDFGKYAESVRIVEEAIQKAAQAEIQTNNVSLDIGYGQIAIPRMGMLAALLYVGMRLQANQVSIPEFVALFGYLNQLSTTLPAVGQALNQVFSSYPDLRFVFGELARPSEITDPHPEIRLNINGAPGIQVQDISFQYPGKQPTFDHLSLEIKAGQTIAIVSESGGGKSTLFNLLYGYYTPSSGRISINGQNIAEISRVSLQNNIGLIGQNPNLFNGSVRDNIKFGAKDAASVTDEMLFELAAKLNLAGSICSLSKQDAINMPSFVKGLDVDAGEGGKALSGGQQQKVAILRGFLKNAPIRLLDEITASLDAESAMAVVKGVKKMTKNTTTLIITHRLSEITGVDTIFVVHKGKVAAQGTHQELLLHCPIYQNLWKNQNHDNEINNSTTPSVTGVMGLFHHPVEQDKPLNSLDAGNKPRLP